MQIFLARNQVQAGPYTLTELNNMLATNQIELSDLMWHTGMDQWKTVGEMTQGQYHYNPDASASASLPEKRVSVADLYGKKEPEVINTTSSKNTKPNPFATQPFNKKLQSNKSKSEGKLASIGNRVLAVIIDFLLLIACYMPFLSGLNYDISRISATAGDVDKMKLLAQSVPEHLSTMTSLMFLSLFVIQLVLLLRRGQTLGKLITGVRIVDMQTKKLASVTNVILLRSLVTSVIYILPVIGPIFVIADFVVMVINKQRRSLHDKFAKTLVVKAEPEQLNK